MPNKTSFQSKLIGVFSPTLTAFGPDGSLDLSGTKSFVRFLLNEGIDGLTPLGSAGEPVALTSQEKKQTLEAIVAENNGKVPIVAGITDYSTAAAIDMGLHAKSLGCDGLMLLPPLLLIPPKRDVINHLQRIREKVDLPLMLYNVPFTTGIEITPQELHKLAEEDIIQAVKWSHVEVSRIRDTRYYCGPDFPVFVGNDVIAFEGLAAGADGWISALPMIVPALTVKLHRLLTRDKNLDAARELWYRLLPIVHLEFAALQSGNWDPHIISVTRAGALLRGLPVGASRPPLSSVEPAVRDSLRKILVGLEQL